jgi:integrase
MNSVDSVKSRDEINSITHLLKKIGGNIYSDIWKVGLNLGLRITDLLSLKYSDLDIDNRTLKLKEQKTGKSKEIRLNNTVIDLVERRRNEFPDDVWLFQVHSNRQKNSPISRYSVSKKFQEIGEIVGIQLNTHSMRKSRGWSMYSDGLSIEIISKVLNHSSPSVTMRYLGITKEEVLETYDTYEL